MSTAPARRGFYNDMVSPCKTRFLCLKFLVQSIHSNCSIIINATVSEVYIVSIRKSIRIKSLIEHATNIAVRSLNQKPRDHPRLSTLTHGPMDHWLHHKSCSMEHRCIHSCFLAIRAMLSTQNQKEYFFTPCIQGNWSQERIYFPKLHR